MTTKTTKICPNCNTEKGSDMFYRRSGNKYLLRSHCIECEASRKKELYIENREKILLKSKMTDRVYRRERVRRYYENNQEKVRATNDKYNKSEKGRAKRIISAGKYKSAHPKRHKAHELLRTEVRAGRMLKPIQCEECHQEEVIQAHHCDYNKPLSVLWLCVKCHTEWHKNFTPIY